jgi:hypothetical protein
MLSQCVVAQATHQEIGVRLEIGIEDTHIVILRQQIQPLH